MLINILISYFPEKKEEFYGRRVFLCGSTRFPASIGFQLEYFSFWTSDSCLRISDFIHLHGTFLKYPKTLINFFLLSLHMNLPNSFVRSMKAKLSHRIQKSSHLRTIKINPVLRPSPLLHEKSSFSEEYCTLVQTSAEKTYAIQNENQKTLSLLSCSKPAGYSNLTKNPPTLSAEIACSPKKLPPLRPTTRRHKACSCRHGWAAVCVPGA